MCRALGIKRRSGEWELQGQSTEPDSSDDAVVIGAILAFFMSISSVAILASICFPFRSRPGLGLARPPRLCLITGPTAPSSPGHTRPWGGRGVRRSASPDELEIESRWGAFALGKGLNPSFDTEIFRRKRTGSAWIRAVRQPRPSIV